ncbi:uncharacterized protein LOC125178286 [Hyalella azteca]|uniref:Uncharacterized protein LOC125178286 n=1 Tax=Hyalella azteca TaxID=294128 RepID=A0A979FKV3_HYAAZ|nr:uncharacterized protein LOC125178286 [Hyalella azteca]
MGPSRGRNTAPTARANPLEMVETPSQTLHHKSKPYRRSATQPEPAPSSSAKKRSLSPNNASKPKKNAPAKVQQLAASKVDLAQEDASSIISGVLSDSCESLPNSPASHSNSHQALQPLLNEASKDSMSTTNEPLKKTTEASSARIDLNSAENAHNLPQSTRQVILTSSDAQTKLSRLNPFRIAKAMDALCGPVQSVEHQRSGALLITTKTLEQVHILLDAKILKIGEESHPVTGTIAWSTQFSYGKIFAPELQDESLDFLLTILKEDKVVGIRKLLSDPKKSSVPLYVLTFLSPSPPNEIRVGYCPYTVDKYYPSPLRCGQCLRYGHSKLRCSRQSPICAHCSQSGHSQEACPNSHLAPKCINCKGPHPATSRQCPYYESELRACQLTTDEGLSFPEARAKARTESNNTGSLADTTEARPDLHGRKPNSTLYRTSTPTSYKKQPQPAPLIHSEQAFPSLSQLMMNNRASSPPPPTTAAWPTIASQPHASSTQTSTWLTQGQRTQHTPLYAATSLSNLPNLPDSQPETLPAQCTPLSPTSQTQPTTLPTPTSSTHTTPIALDFTQLLIKLLPLMIRLLLATQLTDKIECITELGRILQADSLVSESLKLIGHSSIAHTC